MRCTASRSSSAASSSACRRCRVLPPRCGACRRATSASASSPTVSTSRGSTRRRCSRRSSGWRVTACRTGDLCFMRDKAAVGADLYVEDSPANVAALRADGHETIVVVNSTNRHLPPPRAASWDEVEHLVVEALERWQRG
ncbi:MAG: hypothetical protein M5U08_18765 [Burkholderiales bacterium]|nr:hypothetical protein [Burkholderiales bacterium]